MLPQRRPPPASDNYLTTTANGRHVLKNPSWDNYTYLIILLVILIPVIFTIILCTITYCIYRHNRKRSARAPTNSPIVPVDRSGAPPATVIYNAQHSPFIFEELPPSYDSLTDIKKQPYNAIPPTTNTNEQFQLTLLPNTTLTNTNEGVTTTTTATAAIIPTAPTAPTPPPSYIHLDESNK